ncbi:tail protein [Xenorhabdus mauleonii]|uniref:Phage tail fibre repeat-containing protein n=1 Tax=Xenorhabdus mauleonii TaxID=351675 RepID=A0A1I3WS86_9GAMM|nr:phage tail protein [Xenorhabdus mauleonii]PHM38140.1 tail protein [Xenorhabdus mauleonii]SFK10375.1 Phage tail fibre repeat-containing protein [Xenorhabdus mauleonii]
MSNENNKLDTSCPDDCDLLIVPSRKYVKDTIDKKIEEHVQSRNHPYATLTDRGFVTLSNDTDSDSEMTAATSQAVKTVFTAANTADQKADNANTNANTRLAKGQNGADIPDKSAFMKNIGLGDARFVIERGSNVYGAWVIWSDGAIELFGKGEPVAGLATVNFPIELPSISYYISIAEHIADDTGDGNAVHVSIIIDRTLTKSGFQARCQMVNGQSTNNAFSWRLYYPPS